MKIAPYKHIVHIIPLGDLRLHDAQIDCWCYPMESTPGIWGHNAKDCREARERQGNLKSSPGWILVGEKI